MSPTPAPDPDAVRLLGYSPEQVAAFAAQRAAIAALEQELAAVDATRPALEAAVQRAQLRYDSLQARLDRALNAPNGAGLDRAGTLLSEQEAVQSELEAAEDALHAAGERGSELLDRIGTLEEALAEAEWQAGLPAILRDPAP
jgi:chromosome segregation ATPase